MVLVLWLVIWFVFQVMLKLVLKLVIVSGGMERMRECGLFIPKDPAVFIPAPSAQVAWNTTFSPAGGMTDLPLRSSFRRSKCKGCVYYAHYGYLSVATDYRGFYLHGFTLPGT